MSVVGNTTTPSVNFDYSTYTGALAASYFVMPSPGGLITDIHVYCRTYSGSSASGYLCLWNGSGGLEASVAVTIPGGNGWVGGTLGTPYYVGSGTGVFIGAQVTGSAGLYILYNSASSPDLVDVGHNTSVPGAIANFAQHGSSQMGAYGDFITAEGWVWNGSSWVSGECVVWNGSSWVNPSGLVVWNGSSWVQAV